MPLRNIRIKVFRGAQNLPLYIAQKRRLFEKYGLYVELLFTKNSVELRDGLANGEFEIAHTAADNAIAMKDVAGHDVTIFMGGDSGLNELFSQPSIKTIASLKGGTIIVDAPNTAYALQAKKVLLDAGLEESRDYSVVPVGATYQRIEALKENPSFSASVLNPPFSEEARQAGFHSLGRIIDLIGAYQATTAFAMRDWLEGNPDLVVKYVSAYIEAVRFVLDASNRETATSVLEHSLGLSLNVAGQTYSRLVEPGFGLDKDACIDMDGLRNVLRLRSQLEGSADNDGLAASRYVDVRYYRQALQQLTSAGTAD